MEIILTIFLAAFCYDQLRKNCKITYSLNLEQEAVAKKIYTDVELLVSDIEAGDISQRDRAVDFKVRDYLQKEISDFDRRQFNKYQVSDLKNYMMVKLKQDKESKYWHEIFRAIEIIHSNFRK